MKMSPLLAYGFVRRLLDLHRKCGRRGRFYSWLFESGKALAAGCALCGAFGCQPMIAYIRKKPITYARATCQPCLSQSPTERPCGYMLQSATPAEEPNQIIEPPKPTA